MCLNGRTVLGTLVFAFVALAPSVFLGIDFSDFGFHFVNQSTLLAIDSFFFISAYCWASNLIPGLLVSALKSFFGFKVLGVLVWLILAVCFHRWSRELLKKTVPSAFNNQIYGICVAAGILFSAKPIVAGALVIPDYYTVPLVLLVWLVFELSSSNERGKKELSFLLLALFALPWFRWPLLLTGFCGLVVLVMRLKGLEQKRWVQWTVPILYLIYLYLYKVQFLDRFSPPIDSEGHGLSHLFSLYLTEAMRLLFLGIQMLMAAVGGYWIVSKLRPPWKTFGYLACVTLFFVFFVLAHFGFVVGGTAASINQRLILAAVVFFGLTFWRTGFGLREQPLVSYVAVSFFVIGLYPLGSDTGLVKMGYLSFLLVVPAAYIFSTTLPKCWMQKCFVGAFAALAVLNFYSSLYRDDIAVIVKRPAFFVDDVLGPLVTTERNVKVLKHFKEVLGRVEPQSEHILIAPYAPLLGSYSAKFYSRLSWPEIKSDATISAEIYTLCNESKGTVLILSKINLASPLREVVDPTSISSVPKIWQRHCGHRVLFENETFVAYANYRTELNN